MGKEKGKWWCHLLTQSHKEQVASCFSGVLFVMCISIPRLAEKWTSSWVAHWFPHLSKIIYAVVHTEHQIKCLKLLLSSTSVSSESFEMSWWWRNDLATESHRSESAFPSDKDFHCCSTSRWKLLCSTVCMREAIKLFKQFNQHLITYYRAIGRALCTS